MESVGLENKQNKGSNTVQNLVVNLCIKLISLFFFLSLLVPQMHAQQESSRIPQNQNQHHHQNQNQYLWPPQQAINAEPAPINSSGGKFLGCFSKA